MVEDDDDQSNSVDNRTSENQTNSNNEIRATNTQDNLENQSNANSGDDTNVQESESQSRRNSSRQSLRRTSPRITREQEKFQALLQELSTPAKGEKAENVDDAEEDADGSASQSLARLYQKATRAGLRVTKANQDEILCWYKYAEGFKNRVRDIGTQDSSVTDPTARSRAYREVSQHLPGITEANLPSSSSGLTGNEKTSDRAIDAFKAYNRNLCHQAEKKGNNFEAMIFDMMNNAIEEACTDHLVKHLSANK
ncbi:unnamed protein product [Rhizophagus irregularis]|nr:unnamed protein product [Rhizophagus irregularis]